MFHWVTRMLSCLLATAFFLLSGYAEAAPQPPLANDVILIVRHAEKPDTGSGLTPTGQQRARAYVHYFERYQIDAKVMRLDYLIASADTKHSQRPRLTIEPLSNALQIPIDSRFHDNDIAPLAQAIESRPRGRTILICWHHGEIPALLQALGANSNALLPRGKWPNGVYDWVIQLRYDSNGHLLPGHARRVSEHLLPGDAD